MLFVLVVLDDYRPLLSDAALYRQVILARHVTPITDQSRDEVKVTVLSDLQETQDKESKVLTDKMASMVRAAKMFAIFGGLNGVVVFILRSRENLLSVLR